MLNGWKTELLMYLVVLEHKINIVLIGGGEFPVIVSPFSYISKTVTIGEGTIVMHQALINTNVIIGTNNIINSESLIEHDTIIGASSLILKDNTDKDTYSGTPIKLIQQQ